LTVSFDGFKAVDGLNLYIEPNECHVIIGPNGAGKTTLLDLICGRTAASGGSVKFHDKELLSMREDQIVHAGVGRKFQTPSVYEVLMLDEPVAGMSVAERKKTAELLKRIITDRSVIVIEHDMGFVVDIATRVTVLHQGQVLSEGSMEHVQNDPKVVEVYLGH
ncbi:MAG: ATP-binding cassette domain-containing protein, partial [Guyparkeria sp.]